MTDEGDYKELTLRDTGLDQWHDGRWCRLYRGQDETGEWLDVLVVRIESLKASGDKPRGRRQ